MPGQRLLVTRFAYEIRYWQETEETSGSYFWFRRSLAKKCFLFRCLETRTQKYCFFVPKQRTKNGVSSKQKQRNLIQLFQKKCFLLISVWNPVNYQIVNPGVWWICLGIRAIWLERGIWIGVVFRRIKLRKWHNNRNHLGGVHAWNWIWLNKWLLQKMVFCKITGVKFDLYDRDVWNFKVLQYSR